MPAALRTRGAAAVALFALLAACFTASAGLRASRGAAITGDEPFYLLTTQSLLQDGDLDLRQQYDRFSYRAFFDHPEPLWRQSRPLPDGRLLSPHGVGLSVYLLPGFAVGGLAGAQAQMLLTTAICLAITFLLVARVTGRARLAWGATLAVGLSATMFVYATEIYPEAPAALCLVAALLLLQGGAPGASRLLALVALVSALAWLGPKYVPPGMVLALFALWRADVRGRAVFVGASAVSGAAYVAWHLWVYGALTPYSVNLIYFDQPTVQVAQAHLGFLERAYRPVALLVDREFGVARWAPVLLPAAAAIPLLPRRGSLGVAVVALIVVQVLMATFVAITMRGWWFPGRTLVAVLPLLAWPLAECAALVGRRGLVALGGLAVLGGLVTAQLAVAASTGEVRVAVDPFALDAPAFRALAPLFPDYRAWTPHTIATHLAWTAALLAGAALLLRADARRGHRG
ncbi:MAG: hypothetical protein AB7G21_03895 [Dehalococcoidia bacterium]